MTGLGYLKLLVIGRQRSENRVQVTTVRFSAAPLEAEDAKLPNVGRSIGKPSLHDYILEPAGCFYFKISQGRDLRHFVQV